ncbi:MAG: thioredoxin [archaeon]|nr:thioredoxin [archaeon]
MTVDLTEHTFDSFVNNNNCVIVDCWAPWCGPCRRMGPIIEEISKDLHEKVAVGKLNTDEAPGIAARFQINAIPTLLVFKDKLLVGSLIGLRSKQDIIDYLTSNDIIQGRR